MVPHFDGDEMNMGSGLMSGSSSSGSVPLGDDSFEDACSICLEPFTSTDPPSVTECKHEYHLHCILEWAQRRIECPLCSQHIVLRDLASQELLAGMESDSKFSSTYQENGVNSEAPHVDESDEEHPIIRHFSAIASRACSMSRRRRHPAPAVGPSQILPSVASTNTSNVTQASGSSPYHQNLSAFLLDFDSAPSAQSHVGTQPNSPTVFPSIGQQPPSDNDVRPNSSEFTAFSESLKFKLATASTRYKESISKVRGLKEKLIAHNDSVKELGRGVQREVSARFAGVSKMIERLDITQKRAGASVPLSSYTMGTSKSPRGKELMIRQP